MEKRYESDLGRREKWQQQWKTIVGLRGKKRLEYLWSYYRLVLVILLGIILVVHTGSVMIKNSMEHTVLSVVIIDAAKTDGSAAEALEELLLKRLGFEGKHDHIELVLSVTSSGTEENVAKRRVALSTVGGADLVICNENVYEEYACQHAFADMKETAGDEYEAYEKYSRDGSLKLERYGTSMLSEYVRYSPAYVCILEHSTHRETAWEAIKQIVNP